MVSNLIDNALRYTPSGGRVTVAVLPMGDFVIVEVTDSGVGISESDAELVFEPFYRVDDSHSEGSGLGLAIVRQIADLHRANIALRPNPEGRGTVARVVFPAYGRVEAAEDGSVSDEGAPIPTGFV
jgi:two-component system sensor histidine kinase TctE